MQDPAGSPARLLSKVARRHTGRVGVSRIDKQKMASIARALALAETDEEPSEDRWREIIAWANARRARLGIPPLLAPEQVAPPEEEFYRGARALGMVDPSRGGA